jgi:DNA-binding NarL/FixJ family response regulator
MLPGQHWQTSPEAGDSSVAASPERRRGARLPRTERRAPLRLRGVAAPWSGDSRGPNAEIRIEVAHVLREESAEDSTRSPIRTVVAEDSYLIREALVTVLGASPEVELVAVCRNGEELQTAIDRWSPEVVLTDVRMPPSEADAGIRIASRLRETHPAIGVVVLSQYAEPSYALALLESGTGGRAYLLKERIRGREELIAAIEKVARGGAVIDPLIVDALIEARSRAANSRVAELTPRERELLAEIAAGNSNGAIAKSRVLTKRAVEKHVNSIFAKLNLPETPDVSRRVKATLIFLAEERAGLP